MGIFSSPTDFTDLHRFFSVSVYYKEKVQFQTNGIEPFLFL